MDYSLLEEHDGHSTHDDQHDVEPEPLRSFEHQPRFASRQRHPIMAAASITISAINAPGIK